MLAVNLGTHTHQVISWNLHRNISMDTWEMWITRPNGKSMLIAEGDEADMKTIKNAFDYAYENNKNIVSL